MAPGKEVIFQILVGAITAINYIFKLTFLSSQDGHNALNAFDPVQRRSTLPRQPQSSHHIVMALCCEDEEIALMYNYRLTKRELHGINWGHWYIKPRSIHWWGQFLNVVMNDDPVRFQGMFRVSPSTFNYICELVRVDLERNPPQPLLSVPNRKLEVTRQVAIALRRLATGDDMTTIGELFGVSNSTVSRVMRRFIKSLLSRGRHHLQWPDADQLAIIKAGFESKWGIPQICGAIDCTHIEVELPGNERSTDFFDKDKNYSFTMQAVVDSNTRFLDVFAGFPGVVHDARVFANSGFKREVDEGRRLNGPSRIIQGVSIPELIIGDAGYTQSVWMLTPLPGHRLAPMYDQYNFKHSSTRMAVERSFGILKGVWRILRRIMYSPDVTILSKMMITCCMLHNIMLDRTDIIDEDLPLIGHHDEGYPRQRRPRALIVDEALLIQNAIVEHLFLLENRR
jgi:hypothetical protein